ncbi:hypothetical protein BJ944DRAFT_263404 [Cunninghamella echinulata]|nr:hypothetical protein BJ944DRAFT_263404 [Cunninghamella echinulata]
MVVLPPLFVQNNKLNNNQLPSIKTLCQDVFYEKPKQEYHQNTSNRRNHYRTTSMPARLVLEPSIIKKEEEERLSMDVLLKAISLEQKMNASFKKDRVKNFVREQQWLHKVNLKKVQKNNKTMSTRRRSRSAPGAPLVHYYHKASLNPTRWYLPNHSDHEHYKSTHDIAQAIVQQHLKSVFEKRKF